MKFHPEKCYFLTISRKNQPIIKKIHSSNSRPPTRTGYNSEISRYFNNICHKSDLLLHYFVHVLVSFTETLKRCSVTSYFYTRSVPLWTQSQLQYWSVLFLLINYFVQTCLFFIEQCDTLKVMQCWCSLWFRAVVWHAVVAIELYLSHRGLAYVYVRYINHVHVP